jgi:protein gp37
MSEIIDIKSKIKNINAVIGCNIGCRYCYARAVAKRFHLTDDFSKPVADLHKLERIKKPGIYFLTGMSDPYIWEKEWLDKSFDLLKQNPRTVGIYLTKAPNKMNLDNVPDNAWMGVTVTCKNDLWRIKSLKENIKCKNYHITFEPLFEDLGDIDLSGIRWIVIGTETGNCKGKIDTKKQWVNNLVKVARRYGCKIFYKEELARKIMIGENIIQELTNEMEEALK